MQPELTKCRLLERRNQTLPKLSMVTEEQQKHKVALITPNDTLDVKLQNFLKNSLIGLEYIVELIADDSLPNSTFICMLCERRGNYKSTIFHVCSEDHRMKLLQTHFPRSAQLIESCQIIDMKYLFGRLLLRVSIELEKHFGRAMPLCCQKEDFETECDRITSQVICYAQFIHQKDDNYDAVLEKFVAQQLFSQNHSQGLLSQSVSNRVSTLLTCSGDTSTHLQGQRNYQLDNSEVSKTLKRSSSEPVVLGDRRPSTSKIAKVVPPFKKAIDLDDISEDETGKDLVANLMNYESLSDPVEFIKPWNDDEDKDSILDNEILTPDISLTNDELEILEQNPGGLKQDELKKIIALLNDDEKNI